MSLCLGVVFVVKAICMMFIRELTTVFFSRLKFAAWIVNCSSNMDKLFYVSLLCCLSGLLMF